MTLEQGQIFVILIASMGLFIWGRWRHDVVALGALLACVIAGLVPEREAFTGFGHPAVITVACVLVLSHGLQRTGAVSRLAQRLLPSGAGVLLSIAIVVELSVVRDETARKDCIYDLVAFVIKCVRLGSAEERARLPPRASGRNCDAGAGGGVDAAARPRRRARVHGTRCRRRAPSHPIT